MNTTIVITFLAISLLGMIIFWLMYRKANNTNVQAQKYLLASLKDESLSDDDRKKQEKQLSKLLQQDKSQGGFKISALLILLVTLASFGLYQKLGTPDAAAQINISNQEQAQHQPQQQVQSGSTATNAQAPQMSMEDAIAQLEAKLIDNPNDLEGQLLFARSQVSVNNYEKAVISYRKANELSPNDSNILTALAESIALFNNNRSFLGEPEGLLQRAVEIEPNNQKALWLFGMTHYEKQNFAKTNEVWTKLYDMMSDEGAKNQLMQQLTDVRKNLGVSGAPDASPSVVEDKPVLMDITKVKLQIDVDEDLLEKLEGKPAMLYVYSKAATGMPMPIAVIKRPLTQIEKTFPVTLELSDKHNLQAGRNLSDFEEVKVGARISFTGNAMPQAGDLQSDEVIVDLSTDGLIKLKINKIR